MFTGIVETLGKIRSIEKEKDNLHLWIESSISKELKVDQSVSHNGCCLTITECNSKAHKVTIILESLDKTNLADFKVNDLMNLERCLSINGRFDGHIVQGHIDNTAICTEIIDQNGSHVFTFKLEEEVDLVIEKGSITVNGVSLTVVKPVDNYFSAAIIPYTYEHTTFKQLAINDKVNIEYDIIGKYVSKIIKNQS